MNSNQEHILSILKNCDSQNPMTFFNLGQKVGIGALALFKITNEMYDSRIINRCTVTRDGVTQVMLWPTGMVSAAGFKALAIPPKKQEQQTMQTEKSKARVMIEMIAERGKATGKELMAASGASGVKPFVKTYLERGLIEISGDISERSYALAPGVTPEQLLHDGRGKSKKSVSHYVAPPDLVPEVGKAITHIAPASMFMPVEVTEAPRFRLAITSDKTMMLFGLSGSPIELDAEQTQTLVEFVSLAF